MAKVRKPTQKRSIETKENILKASFDLFCKKGYHKTNTIEIAKYANVSTGAVYSYFTDKREIFIAAFEQYLNSFSERLFEKLEDPGQPFSLSVFLDRWISSYIDVYATASHALLQLRMMMLEDEEINHHFCNSENKYVSKIVEILNLNGITSVNLCENVYASCILIDALNNENSVFPHQNLNFEILKTQITKTILILLST